MPGLRRRDCRPSGHEGSRFPDNHNDTGLLHGHAERQQPADSLGHTFLSHSFRDRAGGFVRDSRLAGRPGDQGRQCRVLGGGRRNRRHRLSVAVRRGRARRIDHPCLLRQRNVHEHRRPDRQPDPAVRHDQQPEAGEGNRQKGHAGDHGGSWCGLCCERRHLPPAGSY